MKQANRILSFLLALVMLLGLLPVGSIPTANAATDEFGVENEGYIDLPIQTMDFLGDGLLFQSSDCFKSNFSLTNMSSSSHSPESVTVVDDNGNQVTAKFPGEQSHEDYAADLNGNGDAFRILGLIEDQLIGGKIVYTDATVTYIAYSLKERGRYFPSMPSTTGTRVNHAFADLVNTDIPLGTLDATYKKCRGKGGDLLWTDVETCFDLAYYMLHYVWHPVSKTKSNVLFEDSYNNNTFPVYYNIDVDELQRIRLYKKNVDGQDLYVFDSGENKDNGDIIEGISNGTIYSTQQTQDSSKNELTFTALDRKGYESDAYYGEACNTNGKWDGGSTPNNYCFTIRAKGAFVFWKESDLFFEFSGDDDVYFYINDQLVCDIGGIHGRRVDYVYLNELVEAGEIDLEDGQICTFDMFYAERHTTGINLKLSTNIELMDYDLLTQKKQFDARTGLEYANGQAVPYGTPIDYQFSVLNRKTLPASEVSFVDENLGVELSREKIKVSGSTEYVGSADISGEGLEVIYRPYNDDGSLSTEGMVTVDSLEALRSSIAPFTEKLTLSEGKPPRIRTPYRYAVKTAEELRTILGIGVPGYCEFAVYGIERTLQKAGSATGDRIILANSNHIYSNTLRSTARPGTIREGEADVTVFYASPVNGISTCRIKGFDMGDVAAVEPLRIVVDYGKDVDIRLGTFADGADYKKVDYSLEYVGMELPAENEATSKMGLVTRTLPENLLFTAAGDTEIQGENGSFTRTDEALRFTMNGFLEAVERAYAVLSVTPLNDPESGEPATGNEIIGYIYVELQIVPANMVYYEAEDFTNEITLLQKTTEKGAAVEGETKVGWDKDRNFKHDEENAKDSVQDLNPVGQEVSYPDYIGDDEVLFFGFGNTEADRARYDSSVYGYQNFDDPTKVDSYWHRRSEKNVSSIVLDNETGTMIIRAKDLNDGPEVPHNDQYPDIYFDTSVNGGTTTPVLSYNPSKAEVFQVRFKMKNLQNGYYYDKNLGRYHTIAAYAIIQYIPEGGSLVSAQFTEGTTIYAETLNNDTYFTLRGYFNSETVENVPSFTSRDKITHIRFFFGGLENFANPREDGTMTVDYLYIGPEEKAPIDTAYGRDSSYNDDALYSNGTSLYVEGNGVRLDGDRDPANYTEAQFTFTGTGFDLISRTGADQAELRVEIYTDPERTPENRVEGDPLRLKGEQEMYQIPVYSVHDLDYGTYYVSIGVNKKISISDFPQIPGLDFSGMTRGNQFYFDALRIYEPMGEDAEAYAAYCNDGEAHPINRELRSILLTAKDFNALTGTADGAVFVDYSKLPDPVVVPKPEETTPDGKEPSTPPITDHITYDIATYSKEGPNNEVYLGQQQIIAFKLMIYSQQLPARIDVGCKTIDDTPAIFRGAVINANGAVSGSIRWTVESSSAQYISLPLWREQFTYGTDENGVPCYYAYIKIENAATKSAEKSDKNVLSITDLKIAYTEEPRPIESGEVMPTAEEVPGVKKTTRSEDVELPMDEFDPVRFVVDGSIPTMIEELLEDRFDTACEHIGGPMIVTREPSPTEEGLAEQRCVLCGEVLYQENIQTVEGLKFTGASVTLQSDLSIQFKVLESLFTEQGYADPYVVVVDRNGVETVIREYMVKNGKYSFIYKNIAPHRIGDTITATLYATYNGELYCSAPIEYSVARYCYNMLGKTEGNAAFDKLRTLLVDILHYGAESQKYTGYRTEDLCNSGLTPEQLACGTELTRELVNHKDLEHKVVENPTVHWKGAGLNLQESVAIRFRLEAESYEDLEVRVTLAGQTYKFRSEDFDYRADGTFVHFTYLNAAQLSEPVYITAYHDGAQVSNTLCYSVESYAYSKQTVTTIPYLASLVERMMCYGDSAKAYVG